MQLYALVASAAFVIVASAASAAGQREPSITRYLLCEDFDCVDVGNELKACGVRCVPALIELLKTGLPKAEDPRAPEWARARSADALGELGDPLALKPLLQTLGDASPLVRAASARALGRLKMTDALATLEAALQAEKDSLVRDAISDAIAAIAGR